MIGNFSHQYFIHIFRFYHFFDFGRTWITEVIDISLLAEYLGERLYAFLEAYLIRIKEGYVSSDDDAIVLILLLFVKRSYFGCVVPHLLHASLIGIFILLDSQGKISEFEVLLLKPIDKLAAAFIMIMDLCLMNIQLLLLVFQVFKVLSYLLQVL